jgi:hypothetical protein
VAAWPFMARPLPAALNPTRSTASAGAALLWRALKRLARSTPSLRTPFWPSLATGRALDALVEVPLKGVGIGRCTLPSVRLLVDRHACRRLDLSVHVKWAWTSVLIHISPD